MACQESYLKHIALTVWIVSICYIILSKSIIKGVTAGSVKG